MRSELILAGWYVAVEADQGQHMTPSSLQSPFMRQASANCTLRFYYNMYGDGMFCIYTSMCAAMKKKQKTFMF